MLLLTTHLWKHQAITPDINKVHVNTSVQRIMSPHCFYLDLKSQLSFFGFPLFSNLQLNCLTK